jgi:magnesium-transporting ATPase (P-type)
MLINLYVLYFFFHRKMMSVIVRMANGKIKLFSKGADSTIINKLDFKTKYLKKTTDYLLSFSSRGLRTLVIAQKNIDEYNYKEWNTNYQVK